MEYYIKTDTNKLKSTASAIEKYISETRSQMESATSRVNNNLLASWQGTDYEQFKYKWAGLNDESSANSRMLKELESYARYLRFVAETYEDAQENAVCRANKLPK